MRRVLCALAPCALVFVLLSCQASRREELPPPPRRWVTDEVGMLPAPTRARLDARLAAYQRATGHQVIVWIGATSGDLGPELFAARAFEAWRVGRRGLDDGAAIFVFARDRTVRIEVGYGLEPVLTDADASRLMREQMLPRFREGDPGGAVEQGVGAVLAQIGGETAQPRPQTRPVVTRRPIPTWLMIVAGIAFLILFITNPRLAILLLASFGGRGGGFSGGGDFSGGGGRSGGGGATGHW
jgi:uncharacterized protein